MNKMYLGKFSPKYLLITFLAYLAALSVCCLISLIEGFPDFSAVIFDLAVIITARYTEGFVYSIASALAGTVTVSYAFTYPYMDFGFPVAKAALTFVTMLVTAIMVCMLTTEIKVHAKTEAAAERSVIRAELLRSLSHDLRTPLTAVSGSISALLENHDQLPDNTQKLLAAQAYDQVQCLIKMVENILTITKIEDSAAVIMKSEPVEEAIGAAVSKFSGNSKGISIKTDIPPEPLFVPMDSLLIEQVIMNLLDNSINHGKKVTEIVIHAGKTDNEVLIRISDNGSGINPQTLDHLFEPMTKYGDSDSYIGIGLSMCKAVIKLHGGEIRGYNDEGAVFEFTLPLKSKPQKHNDVIMSRT